MTLTPDSLALPVLFLATLWVVGEDGKRHQITVFLRKVDPEGVICAVRELAQAPYLRLGTGELLYFPADDLENPSRFEGGLLDARRGLKLMEAYQPEAYDDWLLDALPVSEDTRRVRDARLMLDTLRSSYMTKVDEVEAWVQNALKTGRENGIDAYAEELLTYTVRPFNEFFRHMVLALRNGDLQRVVDHCQILRVLVDIELNVRHHLNHPIHHVTRHVELNGRAEELMRRLPMSRRHELADKLHTASQRIATITNLWVQPPTVTLRTLAEVEKELRKGSAFVAKDTLRMTMERLSFLA